jgi:hypothetical protein
MKPSFRWVRLSGRPSKRRRDIRPKGLIAKIRRNSNYPLEEWRAIASTELIDPNAVGARLRSALAEAESFVSRMPTGNVGLLFLQEGEVVQPEPRRLETYRTHAGRRRGQWPSSPEITAAMFGLYSRKPRP